MPNPVIKIQRYVLELVHLRHPETGITVNAVILQRKGIGFCPEHGADFFYTVAVRENASAEVVNLFDSVCGESMHDGWIE